MRTLTRALSACVAVTATVVLAAPATGAASAAPKARTDKVSVISGSTVLVDVLDNDRVDRRGAKVKVVGKAHGATVATVAGKKVRIDTGSTTFSTTFTVRYKVTDRHGRKDSADIRVTVTPSDAPTPAPVPPTPTPDPVPVPEPDTTTLLGAINALDVATENRTGYTRNAFKHWNSGSKGLPYCDTRGEVLVGESVVAARWDTSCVVTGQWFSYYDGVVTTDPSTFDIDHMVPLAEAWDSGASAWDAATREAYANDQDDPRSLVAVTASSNRSKSDQDPAEWLPALSRCRYVGEWVAVKLRFDLAVDVTEQAALVAQAHECGDGYEILPVDLYFD